MKINPEWKKYNDLYNEGGDGYNPHEKYFYEVPHDYKPPIKNDPDKIVHFGSGSYTKDQLIELIGKLTDSIDKHTTMQMKGKCRNARDHAAQTLFKVFGVDIRQDYSK